MALMGWSGRGVNGVVVLSLLTGVVQTLRVEAEESAQVDQARAIVHKADEVRFPVEGFQVELRIQTFEPGHQGDVYQYRVLSKDNDNTVVMTLAPASDRGQMLLMKGRDLWLFAPTVSQPVRLSLAQRLTGLVANGDIARANFAGDYTARLIGTEKVGPESLFVLDLTAVDRYVTYHRVKYWVRQSNYWPYKAEFYSLSGRLLKTCNYEGFQSMAGRIRPSRLVMTDALRADTRSVMDYTDLKARDLPEKIFTKEYLKKLE